MILGWGLTILIVVAAVAGEGWRDERNMEATFTREPRAPSDLATGLLHRISNGSPMGIQRVDANKDILDAVPTPSTTPPADAPEMDAGLEAAEENNQESDVAVPAGIQPFDGRGVVSTICSYDWNCDTALRIVSCESHYKMDAISWGGESFGLFQLHAATWAPIFEDFWQTWDDPMRNTEMAWEIYKRAGYSWAPWDCW